MEGFLITLLMFSIPIAAALIDKKMKAGRSVPQVNAEPIDFSEDIPAEEEGVKAIVREKESRPEYGTATPQGATVRQSAAQKATASQTTVQSATLRQSAVQGATPQGATASASERSAAAAVSGEALRTKRGAKPKPTVEEILKDRKKLILYSEILKPKFDEREF